MINHLIKLEQDMAQVILGVIKKKIFSLSNYNLTKQLLLFDLLAAFIGLSLLILINLYLIINDKSIDNVINETNKNLKNINFFLENNSIVRVPLFKNCRIDNIIDQNCKKNNSFDEIIFSEPELEPTSAQQYIINNFLETPTNISIYNDGMIEIIDSGSIFIENENNSDIRELDLMESSNKEINLINSYLNSYNNFFNIIYSKLIRKKYIADIVPIKNEIKIFKETTKKRSSISQKFINKENNIVHYVSSPIISNNKIYGITIISHIIEEKNNELSYLSFILFNFYILFIFVIIILSLYFIRDLISPLRELSKITLLERQKIRTQSNIKYPKRNDEIGILSNQIQDMSKDLKSQMNQLEKFTADVAHELKNPLTSIKSSSELLLSKSVTEENKIKLIKNFNNEVDRMNRLISDIANFSKTIAEIETENFKLINLNKFLIEFKKNYIGNKKNIKIILKLENKTFNVLLNQEKFLQVILNLIDNSVSVSKENTSILINSSIADQNTVELKFHDQGGGINFEEKNKIFDRFYTDRSIKKNNHSGLGLSICREIIKSFNGTIELTKSDNFDFRGACFIIKLPLQTIL